MRSKSGQKETRAPEENTQVDHLVNSIQEIQDKLDKVLEKDIETNVDINKLNGDKFEKFVVRKLNQKHYSVVEWAGDKYVAGIYAETTREPDLKLRLTSNGKNWLFAVECKWRKRLEQDSSIEFAYAEQLKNYQRYQERTGQKTFIVLGVGEPADNPEWMFIIPVEELTKTTLTRDQLKRYFQRGKGDLHYNPEEQHLTLLS